MNNTYDAVAPKFREQALKRLHERIDAGESVYDILQVSDKFYCDKIVAGYVEISYTLYTRIMGCNAEDGIEE